MRLAATALTSAHTRSRARPFVRSRRAIGKLIRMRGRRVLCRMTLGSTTYTKTELLTTLGMPVGKGTKADASLILAYQLIAAKLNIANGADGTPVTSTITHADSLLSGFSGKLPYQVKPSSTNGQGMVNDAN